MKQADQSVWSAQKEQGGCRFPAPWRKLPPQGGTEPGIVAMSVQPIYLETGPILLSAPAPAAFQKKKFHDDV